MTPPIAMRRATQRSNAGTGTIAAAFDHVAAERPDQDALVARGQRRRATYRSLQHDVDRCSRGLLALGLRPSDRVGLWAACGAEWVVVQLALMEIGIVLVPLDPLILGPEAEETICHTGMSVLLLSPAATANSPLELLRKSCPELSTSPRGQLQSRALPALHSVVVLPGSRPSGAYAWEDLLALADDVPAETLAVRQREGDPHSPAILQPATGDTSPLFTASDHHLLTKASLEADRMGLSPRDRVCLAIPNPGIDLVVAILAGLLSGATLVLPEAFNPAAILASIQQERCTVLHGVLPHVTPLPLPGDLRCYGPSTL